MKTTNFRVLPAFGSAIQADETIIIPVIDTDDNDVFVNENVPTALTARFGGTWVLSDFGEDHLSYVSEDTAFEQVIHLEPCF